MSYLLFLDESGHDQGESPYEVLAGISLLDRDLWNFVCRIHDAEIELFGQRVSPGELELKGKKLLKRKTFKHARQMKPFAAAERSLLAKQCLDKGRASLGDPSGGGVTKEELTALSQAKIAFVQRMLEICGQFRVNAFASIVKRGAPRPGDNFLRKDYSYLFERYFYFLDDRAGDEIGMIVFDELERSQCHLLVDQMSRYFRDTAIGKMRASRVIPEPFFVHSHLTTAIQVADIIAYIIAWGVRVHTMDQPARKELAELSELVCQLRYQSVRKREGEDDFFVWSFALIDDLRPRSEINKAAPLPTTGKKT